MRKFFRLRELAKFGLSLNRKTKKFEEKKKNLMIGMKRKQNVKKQLKMRLIKLSKNKNIGRIDPFDKSVNLN